MAAGGGRSMDESATWAVALVCLVIISISLGLEQIIHIIGKGKVQFLSEDAIHQLHMFIFPLAVFHVLYCIITLALGRAKMRMWKTWESETKTLEYQCLQDTERYRFARDTTFGRRHLNFWCRSPVLIWIVCFFRQFLISVPKVDYLTLRHGFIIAHLAPQSQTNFDFQKYINRSLEEDFKVVVGISPDLYGDNNTRLFTYWTVNQQ